MPHGKRTLRFGNRVREDTVFVCHRRFVRDDVEYVRGDIVPKDVPRLKRLWNLEKVRMYITDANEPVGLPIHIEVEDPLSDDSYINDEHTQEDPHRDPARPEPYKSGPGWWRIEGIDHAFRSADEAAAAWDIEHG